MKDIIDFFKRLFGCGIESTEEIRRRSALEKGNELEGYMTSAILEYSNSNNSYKESLDILLSDYRKIITSLELIKTPIWNEIDWSLVMFKIETIEDVYSRYSDKLK